jgi:hypothetical protein
MFSSPPTIRILRTAAAILIGCQILAALPYLTWPANFIPSDVLKPVAAAWGLLSAAATILVIWPPGIKIFKDAPRENQHKKACGLVLVSFFGSAIFGFFMGYFFIWGPVSYRMHRLNSGATLNFTTQKVKYAHDLGSRSCSNSAVLVGDSFTWPRHVCGISSKNVALLRKGGAIRILGTTSNFGTLVLESEIEAPNDAKSN